MSRDTFFELISPANLYAGALVFSTFTAAIVLMIYVFLYSKKRRYKIKKVVTAQLNDWIGEALTESVMPDIIVPESLARHFKKKFIREFVVDSLINVRKNLAGSISVNITTLYETLGLRRDSVVKAKSLVWHKRARGIYELYMMNQRDALPDILAYTNSNNEFVRMEAQTAIIGFSGFDGLVFLDNLSYPLYEWQQIKLLEQLNTMDMVGMPHLPVWLKSENEYVRHFSLKIAEIYQQFYVHDEVVNSLEDEKEKIRTQAIKTLGNIAAANTISILKHQYTKESLANKREILKQIARNGTTEDIDFLLDKLNETDDSLVLEAGRAISNIDGKTFASLFQQVEGNLLLTSVFKQVKYETTT